MISNYLKTLCLIFIIYIGGSLPASAILTQNPASKTLTLAEIDQKIQTIKDRQNLSDELKKRILSSYAESQDYLSEAQAQEAQAEAYKQSLLNLPIEATHLAKQITDAENNLKNHKPEKLNIFPTDELEQRLIIEKTSLSDLDSEINRIETLIGDLLNRPQLIRAKISEIKTKQAQSQHEQQTLVVHGIDNIAEKESRQIWLDSRGRLFISSLKALELENISDPIRLEVEKNRIHLLNLQREQLSLLISDLDNFLLDRRQQEIGKEQAELLQAEKAAAGKHPLIQEATRENMAYSRSLQDITKSMEQFQAQKNELEQRYKQLEKDFQSAEQKINLAGLSPALGNLLREQRRNLPQAKQYSKLDDSIQSQIAKASLEGFKLEEVRKNLADIGTVLTKRLAQQLPANISDIEKLRIRTELRMLLNDQKELVGRLASVYSEYSQALGDVDFSLQQMLSVADKYRAYLDERLLWVPSAPVIDKYFFKDVLTSLLWFLQVENWEQLFSNFGMGLATHIWLVAVGFGLVFAYWQLKSIAKARIKNLRPRRIGGSQYHYHYNFNQTLLGLAHILILAIALPLILAWLAVVLALSGSGDAYTHDFSRGLLAAALSLSIVQFFYLLFKPEGVAEALFEWQSRNISLLYKQFKWTRFVLVPSIFIIAMTGSDVFSEHSYALGRAAMIISMLVMTYTFHRLAHPRYGLSNSFQKNAQGWNKALPYICYIIAVGIPLAIIGFAVEGYYQSALEIQQKLIISLRLIFFTALLHEVAQHWLAVTKRQLALRNARQKRRQTEQAAVTPLESGFMIAEPLLDLSKINQQSHKLLSTIIIAILLLGFWMIWNGILPAFSILDRIELWQHSVILDGKETLERVTLTNLLISLVYTGISFILVSNFPALVDLLSVGKFVMAPGSRYALIHLMRYLMLSIAFLAIANELGGSWSQVQWLVAALSVGLGFGLQEIFANMVSGIILLFERPIRVGDTVTIGSVTGRVSRIQMRATHIVDWDRKELVVPNKLFITDQLINWTLSDTVTRIVVSIGIAYGEDIGKVEHILRDAITATPLVLAEPHANVVFIGFGDSALQFDIHVFVHELSDRLEVGHVLRKNIYEALLANHIEIPFPQRDIHIRSYPPGVTPVAPETPPSVQATAGG